MRNPKSQIRSPKQGRRPKAKRGCARARSVLECAGQRSGTPLFERAECGGLPAAGPETVLCAPQRQSAVAAGALPAHSTTWRLALALGLLSSVLGLQPSVLCPRASAQYALTWWTVDGGGGSSTGGVYAVTGTIGQPEVGPPAYAGGYALVGGFWSIVAGVQTPGAPYLTVFRTATNTVVVSWPLAGAEGWVLEATNALPSLAGPWPVIPPPYQTNGLNLQFIEPAPAGNKFYRLHKP